MWVSSTGLRQLSLESSGARQVLERIRKLEQRSFRLLGPSSDLPILDPADLLRPLVEFFCIDGLLARVLAYLIIEDTLDGELNNAADEATLRIAAPVSKGSCAVEGIRTLSKEFETVSARHITRAEARDYFARIADRVGVRAASDYQPGAHSVGQKGRGRILSRAPTPELRRFWIEASTAGRTMAQLRTLEEECASLFVGSALDQPIFQEDDVVRSLVEFLDIDGMLAGALAPRVTEDGLTLEHLPKPDRSARNMPAKAPGANRAHSAPLSPRSLIESVLRSPDVAPTAKARNEVAGGSVTFTNRPLELPSRNKPAPTPVSKKISVTRAQARSHFKEIAARAGLGAAWSKVAIATSESGPTTDGSDLHFKTAAVANPPELKSERVINDAGSEATPASAVLASTVTNTHDTATSSGVRSRLAHTSRPPVQVELTSKNRKVSGDRWDQVLLPLLETIQSSPRWARAKLPSQETRVIPQHKGETDNPKPLFDVPVTGLRRLAEMAVNADDPAISSETQTTFGDRRMTSVAPQRPIESQVAIGDEKAFASQLAEYLRTEALRHGIRLENI